ncbi:hypothetical protein J6590_096031 [Homalodisca vitripennis]|nr:hypothetical protein J6590_096031 [Homalodisca vitripennis]
MFLNFGRHKVPISCRPTSSLSSKFLVPGNIRSIGDYYPKKAGISKAHPTTSKGCREWCFRLGEGSEVTGPQQQRANSLGVYFRPGGGKLLANYFVTARKRSTNGEFMINCR